MVQGGFVRGAVGCLCAIALLLASGSAASGSMYFGATISGEAYGQTDNAPRNAAAWDLFERHAGKKVAILNQGQPWVTWDSLEVEATHARGAIPLVTMGLGSGVTLADIAAGKHDAAIKKWALEAKAWGHPLLFAPWWEMNGGWYAWGRSPSFIPAWQRFHDVVVGQGASNVTWTWLVNSIWDDPESDPTPYYPGDAYVDWTALDSYNWGRNPAQPDKWITPEQTITPTLKLIRAAAPTKPVAIVENASSEYGGNKTDWIREMLTTYLPHHPEIKAYMWFNWPFQKGDKRSDWPIETSAPAQQQFRKAIGSSLFAGGPVSLPKLTKVPPPPAAANDAARPEDLSPAAEMVSGADVAVAPDGAATIVWSARGGSEWSVFARRVSAAGTRGPVRQLSAAGGDALAPQVAVAPDGTAVVAWVRWDGANFRVQERRLAPDGTPEEATRTLSGEGRDAAAPQVDVAPDGEATVAWQRRDGFHYLVQVRQVAPNGTSESPAQRLSEAGGDAVEPRVAVADDGTATVVWSRFDGEDSIVQTRRVESNGTLEEASEGLSLAGESAIQPRVGVGPDGTATVVWNRYDGANWVIQGRRMTAAGSPAGVAVNLSATGRNAAEPQLALSPAGAATVVWDRFDGTSFIVQARRLDPAGNLGLGPLNLSASGRDAADPQVATSPQGTATVLWSRFDGSSWLVQRRDIDAAGAMGATTTLSATGRSAGDPALAWGEDGTLAMSWRRFAGSGDVVQANSIPKPEPPPPPPPPPPPSSGSGGDGQASGSAGSGKAAGSGGSAALAPDNSFRIAGVRLDRRRGTARLTVAVPGPGRVALDGAVPQQRQATADGKVVLRVLPNRKARRLLERQGSARMKLTVTFIPSGGSPNSRDFSLRLQKQ
jgi:hypothetical protein